jgi:hypothetical protein
LSDKLPIQNGVKWGASLLLLLLKYTIWKGQENHIGQKLNGIYQLLVYADDTNLLRGVVL